MSPYKWSFLISAIYSRKIKKWLHLPRQMTLAAKISTCAILSRCSQSLIHFLIPMNQIVPRTTKCFFLLVIYSATRVKTKIVAIIYPSQMTSFTSAVLHLWTMMVNQITSFRTLIAHKLQKSGKKKSRPGLAPGLQLQNKRRNSPNLTEMRRR